MDVDYSPFANFLPLQQRHTTLKRPLLPYHQYNNNVMPHSAYGLIFKIRPDLRASAVASYGGNDQLLVYFHCIILYSLVLLLYIYIHRLMEILLWGFRFCVVALLSIASSWFAGKFTREVQTPRAQSQHYRFFFTPTVMLFSGYFCLYFPLRTFFTAIIINFYY